jgi:hypothetical protein
MKKIRQLKHAEIKSLRKHILKKQKGRCWICGCIPSVPCLDHHHKKRIKGTGQVRGVLCSACNVFIAKSENNALRYGVQKEDLPERLRKMADYLEKKHYPYIHPSEKPKEPTLSKRSFNNLNKLYEEKYPNRKELKYPKSKKLTKNLEKIYKEFNIEPEFLKGK